jgi:outer membrane protein assembly factor BamB
MSATIELGEWHGDGDDVAPPRPLADRRWVAAFVLAVACLLAPTGAVPAQPGLDDPIWTAKVGLVGYALGAGTVFLAEPGGAAVSALRLDTGQARWRLPVTDLPDGVADLAPGVAVVVSHGRAGGTWDPRNSAETFVDTTAGQVLAHRPGSPFGVTRAGALLVASTGVVGVDACGLSNPPCLILSALEPGTGEPVWRVSLPGHTAVIPADPGPGSAALTGATGAVAVSSIDRFATAGPDGSVVVWDAATGGRIGTLAPPLIPGPDDRYLAQPMALGATIVLVSTSPAGIELSAYGLSPSRRLWSVSVAHVAGDPAWDWLMSLDRCGPWLCLASGDGTVVVDASSGRRVAVLPGAGVVAWLADGSVLTRALTPGPAGVEISSTIELTDPVNGASLARFPDSAVVDWSGGGGRVLLARRGARRTEFTVVTGRGGVRPLGSVPGVQPACRASSAYLVCADAGGTLSVWRLPSY